MNLQSIVEEQTKRVLDLSPKSFEKLRNPSPEHLHDPIQYKDMRELVGFLHRFKEEQDKDPKKLLIVSPDYDTDGITSAAILAASLSVFEIDHRIYIPTISEGYGLGSYAVKKMKEDYEVDGYKVSMILTADNGINAFEGIRYAKEQGIPVLVTDHHLGSDELPPALALVNPNRKDDKYPFKGNAGATVAWKTMLAYAKAYAPEKLNLIQRLIVFAGMANVADVMPILDENRYMVLSAVEYVNEIRKHPYSSNMDYTKIMNTEYPQYNAVFHGLYDTVTLMQKDKDDARKERGKGPIPLPSNEEIFGWYLSPMLNAPRRVHGSPIEGMLALISTDVKLRHKAILSLIDLNIEKSQLRDRVVKALDKSIYEERDAITVFANTRGGIAGLISGKIANNTSLPTIVFSYDNPNDGQVIYEGTPTTLNGVEKRISGSARSNSLYPLNLIMKEMDKMSPNLVSGGGHAGAAGMSINIKDLELFKRIFKMASKKVHEEVLASEGTEPTLENEITIDLTVPRKIIARIPTIEQGMLLEESVELDPSDFASEISQTIDFMESLRPFGKDFEGETQIYLKFNSNIYDMGWNPDFWKTFKFNVFGVEVLTFNQQWSDEVKADLALDRDIVAKVKLSLNEFRGNVTPQFILDPMER